MLATGIDIVDSQRVGRLIDRFGDRFLRQIYCSEEINRYAGSFEQLAIVFAAKEAMAKALGVGFTHLYHFGVLPTDIEIVTPFDPLMTTVTRDVVMRNAAQQRADSLQLTQWTLGMAQLNGSCIAFVLASSTNIPLALTNAIMASATRFITQRQLTGKPYKRSV